MAGLRADSDPKELINRGAPYGEKPPERKPRKEKMESTVSVCLGMESMAEGVAWCATDPKARARRRVEKKIKTRNKTSFQNLMA